MKSLTFVHASRLDLNELGPRVVSIRDHFDKYLDEYPVKSARSKHGLLGPVGKILQEAKGDRWDAISLDGYALKHSPGESAVEELHLTSGKASPGGWHC